MPRADDRVARALARTQEVLLMDEDPQPEQTSPKKSPRSPKTERKSTKSVKSERIIINNVEMDIDKVVQKVRERMSSPPRSIKFPNPPSEASKPEVPSPKVLIEERKSVKSSPRNKYAERPSPKSPTHPGRLPVTEVTVEIIPEPTEKKVSATTNLSYEQLRRSTRDEIDSKLRSMNSQQLRDEIMKLRSEKESIRRSERSRNTERNQNTVYYDNPPRNYVEEKIPIYDEELGTYVLWPKSKLAQYTAAAPEPQQQYYQPQQQQQYQNTNPVKPPLYRRGTTRDAYPTKTYDNEQLFDQNTDGNNYPPTVDIVAVNDQQVEQSTDIDFDNMTDVQKREFLDEMKMKFTVFKKNYPNFPIPTIHDDDNPKWVFGIYEQLLDMAKSDASQPIYQTGMQIVFLVLQVVLTVSGIPAKNFFSFHAKHFARYNTLMAELGEKWGPIIDVTSSIETKLALAIGWNALVYAIVSVVVSKFGDKWGTTVEKMLDQLTTSTTNNAKMQDLERELDGREGIKVDTAESSNNNGGGGGDMMGGLANMLGGLLGGGGGGGNGGGNLLGNLLSAFTGGNGPSGTSATSTERRPPVYDD